jgi:hypothetical protein
MTAKEFIKLSLDASKHWATSLLADMKNAPLATPTSRGGNHPLWILGHMAYSEGALLDEFILGRPNRFEKWKDLFASGTAPTPTADRYPSMDELFAAFDSVRADTLSHLASLSERDLDKPSRATDDFGPALATIGGCFWAMISHVSFHGGQVADARQTVGRKPLMM